MSAASDFVDDVRRAFVTYRMKRRMRKQLAELRAIATSPDAVTERKRETLTIVVPCYAHSRFLPRTIESIAAQTRQPDAVIFINDHSPDDTTASIENALSAYNLKSIATIINNEKNIGQAASLNRAIDAATSDIIMVLNDDDYLFHDAVQLSLDMFRLHPSIHMFGGLCIEFSGDRLLQLYNKELLSVWSIGEIPFRIYDQKGTSEYETLNDLNVTHSGCSFFKESWREVGGYSADKESRVVPFSDRDFQLRFNVRFPIGIVGIPISFWRNNSSVDAGINS